MIVTLSAAKGLFSLSKLLLFNGCAVGSREEILRFAQNDKAKLAEHLRW